MNSPVDTLIAPITTSVPPVSADAPDTQGGPCTNHHCPVRVTLDVIGGKWKLPILWFLRDSTRRYSELQRLISPITPKMLAQQLRELEKDGIVLRTVFPVVPPRVEYSLTPYGRTLQPMLKVLGDWGRTHLARTGAAESI